MFDLEDRSLPATPLDPIAAAAYLADANVLHWIDEHDGVLTGFLICHVLRLRSNEARELLLNEIGVHRDFRRRGIGRELVDEAIAWMRAEGVQTIWVLDYLAALESASVDGDVRPFAKFVARQMANASRPRRPSKPAGKRTRTSKSRR